MWIEVQPGNMAFKTFCCRPCGHWWTRETNSLKSRCKFCGKRRKEEIRMFVCGDCERKWWIRGTVSMCSECEALYKALPYEEEYGIGEYECSCENVFLLRTQAEVEAKCYDCGAWSLPWIVPNKYTLDRKTDNTHSCSLCKGRGYCPSFKKIINISRRIWWCNGVSESKACTPFNHINSILRICDSAIPCAHLHTVKLIILLTVRTIRTYVAYIWIYLTCVFTTVCNVLWL